jgi:hypothetical protein
MRTGTNPDDEMNFQEFTKMYLLLLKRMLPRHLEICAAIDNIDNLIQVIILLVVNFILYKRLVEPATRG